jgi:hypothetical protein
MKKKIAQKKKNVKNSPTKTISESKFWQQLALKQQMFIHAKNNT